MIGFEYKSSTQYKSIPGAIYSLFVIIATFIIGGLFSKEVILRKNPNVNTSMQLLSESKILLDNFPIVVSFTIIDQMQDNYKNFFNISLVNYKIDNQLGISRDIQYDPLEKCNISSFNLTDEQFEVMNRDKREGVFCIKNYKNFYFKNQYSNRNSAFMNLRFQLCDPSNSTCIPHPSENIINNVNIGIALLNSYVDTKNQTHPIKYETKVMSTQISFGLHKKMYLRFINNIFISDNGWIFEDEKITEFIQYESFGSEVALDKSNTPWVYWLIFESPNLRIRIDRNYIKLQDWFANIGGFLSVIFIFVRLITADHLRFCYLNFLKDLVVDKDTDKELKKASSFHELKKLKTLTFKEDKKIINQLNAVEDNSRANIKNAFNSSSNKGFNKFSFKDLNNMCNKDIEDNKLHQIAENYEHKDLNKNEDINLKINNFLTNKDNDKSLQENAIPRKQINDINQAQEKINHHITVKRHMTIKKNMSYLKYIYSIIRCKRDKVKKFNEQIENIEKLVSISAFTKIMTYQFIDNNNK